LGASIGVPTFEGYTSPQGRTFLDRELYLPQGWAADAMRRVEAAVPATVEFRTKPQLARAMLERTREASVPATWVTGDEVYGGDRRLRVWLEERELAHVLAIKKTEPLWSTLTWREVPAATLAADTSASWERLSAGDGAKGPRVCDWTRVPIRPLREPGWAHWLLVRRSLSDPTDLAYYVCFCRADTPLAELVRVAGTRWAIEECFESAKGEVGLDHYEVRRWVGWYRHVTLALLAHAYLTVTRTAAETAAEKGAFRRGPPPLDRPGGAPVALATGLARGAALGGGAHQVRLAPPPPATRQALPLPDSPRSPHPTTTAVVLGSVFNGRA
jgi:SRSO17 transposase